MSEETIRRANEARQLLNHPLLQEAFDIVEAGAFEDALYAADSAKRDHALMKVRVVRDLRHELVDTITKGEAAVRPRPTAA